MEMLRTKTHVRRKHNGKLTQLATDARDMAHDKKIEQLTLEKELILSTFHAEQEASTLKRDQYADDFAERMKLIEEENKAERNRISGIVKNNNTSKKSNAEQVTAEQKGKEGLAKNAMIINQNLLNDNKAIGKGIIVAETAQNIVTSVKNSGGVPLGIPAGLAAASMGLAQLSNLESASKGGGTIGSGGVSTPQIQQPDFEPETSSLEVSEQTENDNTVRIVISDESGNTFLDGLADMQNERLRQGR